MPLYRYRCRNEHKTELLQRMDAGNFIECPECGGMAERIMSVCNNTFGWTPSSESYTDKSKPIRLVRNV